MANQSHFLSSSIQLMLEYDYSNTVVLSCFGFVSCIEHHPVVTHQSWSYHTPLLLQVSDSLELSSREENLMRQTLA